MRPERFPLTRGPKTIAVAEKRRKIVFRSDSVKILFLVEEARRESNNSVTFKGRTHVRGYPEPQAKVNFTPKGQHGWIEYP
jgi:hypothetical protein